MSTQAILASIKHLPKDAQIRVLQRAFSDSMLELSKPQRETIAKQSEAYVYSLIKEEEIL